MGLKILGEHGNRQDHNHILLFIHIIAVSDSFAFCLYLHVQFQQSLANNSGYFHSLTLLCALISFPLHGRCCPYRCCLANPR